MNALAAHRSLTGKREKGIKLTAKEEQQLLDAEVALGQKLAFDMEDVKAKPARAYPPRTDNIFDDLLKMIRPMSFDNEATRMVKNVIWTAIDIATTNPKERAAYKSKFSRAIQKGKGVEVFDKSQLDRLLEEIFAYDADLLKEAWNIEALKTKTAPPDMRPAIERSTSGMDYLQMEMSRYGETDRAGQMSLLSSPAPDSFRADLISYFANAPSERKYEPSYERRETILETAKANGVILVRPQDNRIEPVIRRIQEVYGATILHYTGGNPDDTGFANGSLIFVNAERGDIPESWTIAHEFVHLAQKDTRGATDVLERAITGILTGEEQANVKAFILSQGKGKAYTEADIRTEMQSFLVGDAVSGHDVIGFDQFTRGEELKAVITDWFDSLTYLEPETLPNSPDSLLSSPSPDPTPDEAAIQAALGSLPPIFRQVFEAINNGATQPEIAQRFNLTDRAVTNILNQATSRIRAAMKAADGELTPRMKDGKIDGGRPDLVLGAKPAVAAIDQTRNQSGVPDVRGWGEVNAQADAMLREDYAGTCNAASHVAAVLCRGIETHPTCWASGFLASATISSIRARNEGDFLIISTMSSGVTGGVSSRVVRSSLSPYFFGRSLQAIHFRASICRRVLAGLVELSARSTISSA
jgi:DNA-directed RNA polymerase specialized sigma24 family protein